MRKTKRQKTQEINFTIDVLDARAREALKTKQRLTLYDSNKNSGGLGILIQPTGHASFFWFKKVKGTPVWVKIGKYPGLTIEQARGAASAYTGELEKWRLKDYQGERPSFLTKGKSKSGASLTLGSLHEEYLEKHLKQESKDPDKAVKYSTWQFKRYLSEWKDTKLSHISEDEVRALHEEIGSKHGKFGPKNGKEKDVAIKHGRYTANRVVGMIRTLFNWAIKKKKWSGVNPAIAVERFEEKKRKRYVGQSEDEMPRFFKEVCAEKNIDLRDFVFLALFTGARRSDVLSMQWSHLDLDGRLWKVEDPKNEEPYTVALGLEAVAVLRSRLVNRVENNAWVFPSDSSKCGHLLDLKRGWKKLRKRAKLSDVRVHDLRRTLGSWQARHGTSLQVIGKSLGQKSIQATEVYTHLQLPPVRESVEAATADMLTAARITPDKLLPEAHDEESAG